MLRTNKLLSKLFISSLCVVFLVIAGCSSKSSTPAVSEVKSTAPTTTAAPAPEANVVAFTLSISNWYFNPDDPAGKDRFINYEKAVEKKFKETYPNATIKWNFTPGESYFTKLKAQLATASADDIIIHQQVKEFAKANYVVDLSDQPWVSSTLDAVKTQNTANGKIYAASLSSSTSGVFYNKKMFTDNGWAVPKTWAEFIALCETIKAKGIAPIEYAMKDTWALPMINAPLFTMSTLGKNANFEKELFAGTAKLNGVEVKDYVTKFSELVSKGYLNKNALSITYDQSMQEWGDGKAAMVLAPSFIPGYVTQKNKDFISGFFPLPDEKGKFLLPVGSGEAISINAKSQNVDKAKAFIIAMLNKDVLTPYLSSVGSLSAIKGISAQYPESSMSEVQQAITTLPTILEAGTYYPASAKTTINDALTKIAAGGKLGTELDDAQKNYDKDKTQVAID